MAIFEKNGNIYLENSFCTVEFSKKDTKIQRLLAKKENKDIKGEEVHFFSLIKNDKETIIIPENTELSGDILTVKTKIGDFKIKLEVYEDYFAFELLSNLPEKAYKLIMANIKFDCDCMDKSNTGGCGIALTYWTNPCFYPDCKDLEAKGEVIRHLRDKNARFALIVAPIKEQKAIIKKASLTIDKNYGLVSQIGGAWGRDAKINFSNYILQFDTSKEYIKNNIEFYKSIGVDQIDFHKDVNSDKENLLSYRQGDFKFSKHKNASEFKKYVSDVLNENGMTSGLHTYSFYIDYECEPILSDVENHKDISVLETFTLKDDIDENTDFLPTEESTKDVERDYGFFIRTTPFILIGEEIIKFENDDNGFKAVKRGWAGTKASAHKKGEKILHLDGYYHGICPVPGSELYLKIARNTAETFNEGGFSMIYLDAIDGVTMHCDTDEIWYYGAMFVCEILKYCDKDPLIEYSTLYPSIWAGRGRIGAYDTPYRGYRTWNKIHAEDNKNFIDRYSAPTLGWYWFYPETDKYPGNEHTKYHHKDEIEHMGSLAVMYNFSVVYAELFSYDNYKTKKGAQRNIAIYRKYDDLRKQRYFKEEYLEKIRNGKWEYHLTSEDGKYYFKEKDVQYKKLSDLNDEKRNKAEFSNPFENQTPFIRIEAFMSSDNSNPTTLLSLDKDKELITQELFRSFPETDYSDKLAVKVSVLGNSKKNSAISIKMRCASNSERGFMEYVIDTDFEGWRDFVLLECDNGERHEYPFDENEKFYAIYRSGFHHDRVSSIEVATTGDMSGVKMSSIEAVKHIYEVLKNPTVTMGDEKLTFECELMSTDFIEFDGKCAKVIDRYTNEKEINFYGSLTVPKGDFTLELTAKPLNQTTPRAQVTCIFTGKTIK